MSIFSEKDIEAQDLDFYPEDETQVSKLEKPNNFAVIASILLVALVIGWIVFEFLNMTWPGIIITIVVLLILLFQFGKTIEPILPDDNEEE